ncbi:MAG: hypothetical protein P1U56_12550 [Saprospiraceae bacterium]|nr:hypothetical protein [Saprospiraceae bacterium]
MKKWFFFLLFSVFGFTSFAQSTIVKVSPGSFALGFFDVCYEKKINDFGSLQFSGTIYYNYEELEETAFGIGTGFRFYLTKKEAPRGFYLMPSAGITFGEQSSSIPLGLDLGYQWIWDSKVTIDFSFGPRYFNGLNDDVSDDFDGMAPNAVFGLGYAF